MVGIIHDLDGVITKEIIWFDHKDKEYDINGLSKFQSYVDKADLIIAHNAKFDVNCMTYLGIDFKNTPLHCTQVAEYLINGQDKQMSWGLDDTAERRGLGRKIDEVKDYWNAGVETNHIPAPLLEDYCLNDCSLTYSIYQQQVKEISDLGMEKLAALQMEFIYSLSDMELNGFLFDKEQAEEFIVHYSEEANEYAKRMCEIAGFDFNPASNQQLSAALYGGILKVEKEKWVIREYKTVPYSDYRCTKIIEEVEVDGVGFKPLPKTKRADGYFKTDKSTIEQLRSGKPKLREFKKLLIAYSKASKVVSTIRGKKGKTGLFSKIQSDGRIHAKLNQTIAATGRLTSSDPNGQNLPRNNTSPIKKCVIPTLDGIMQVDLSQVEWRIAAYLSQDDIMIHEINTGIDQHIATVRELMEMKFTDKSDPESKKNRDTAKVFNFRMIYGGSEWGFYLDINMPDFSLKKWRNLIANFYAKYWKLKWWQDKNIKHVVEGNKLVMPTGRWFALYKHQLRDGPGYKYNQIKNYPVQGVAGGDVLPLLCVLIRRVMRKRGMKSKLILTVHDSIIFDYVEEEKKDLAKLCYAIGNNLTEYVNAYYGIDLGVKLEVEVEAGKDYGSISYLDPNVIF